MSCACCTPAGLPGAKALLSVAARALVAINVAATAAATIFRIVCAPSILTFGFDFFLQHRTKLSTFPAGYCPLLRCNVAQIGWIVQPGIHSEIITLGGEIASLAMCGCGRKQQQNPAIPLKRQEP
jgi:hypothetical protein